MRLDIIRCSCALAFLGALSSSAAAQFVPLGDLPGGDTFSQATSVSDDGRIVGGQSNNASTLAPVMWNGTTANVLHVPSGFNGAFINDISGDGLSAVAISPGPTGFLGIRWDASGTPHVLNSPPGTFSAFICMDYDGSAAGGFVNQTFFPAVAGDAVIYTSAGGNQTIGDAPGGDNNASFIGVTNDGGTFVGTANDGLDRPVRWDASNGFQFLPTVAGGSGAGTATNIGANGGIIVGSLTMPGGEMPAYWDLAGDAHLINLVSGYTTGTASAVTADGSKIIGHWQETEFFNERESLAFIWDEINGARPLQDVLINDHGIDLQGWTLNLAADMTPDGRTIVGTGTNPNGDLIAYKVTIPAPGGLALVGALLLPRRRRR